MGLFISALLRESCNKKQENMRVKLNQKVNKYPQGTYTPLWGASPLKIVLIEQVYS